MRRIALTAALCLAAAGVARAEDAKPAQKPAAAPAEQKPPQSKPPTPADTDKSLYAVGLSISKSLEVFNLKPGELDKVIQGMRDAAAGKPKFQLDEKVQQQVNDLARSRLAVTADKEKSKGAAYLEKMSKEKGAIKTESGAIVIPISEGKGATPTAADKVKVHYEGKLVDGKVFDSSRQRGEPAEFPLGGVIKCWTEALQKMKVGGKAKVVCPASIAYGEQGRPPVIPGNAVLTFDVELLDIVK
jgi:FKBP-type peptidyl-prolyl cis-trans isomerase